MMDYKERQDLIERAEKILKSPITWSSYNKHFIIWNPLPGIRGDERYVTRLTPEELLELCVTRKMESA